jgi:ABC-type Mn2+/Zn2+ transport system permease subunit
MIGDFVASWPLFYKAYLAGWLIAVLLASVGVLVVARDQIFIGAAVSQASTLGIAIGLRLGDALQGRVPWLDSDAFLATMAVAFSVAAALLTTRSHNGGGTHEALTGWIFLATASIAILMVSNSPHGTEELHRVLVSTIIGATTEDLVVFAILGIFTLLTVAVANRELLLVATDPTMAAAVGMSTRLWAGGVSVWLGLVVGLSIRTSGVLYAFGCLVLPALVATNLCREMRPMFAVAPLVALATAIVGFAGAHRHDLPPAQMTVTLLCVLLALARAYRRVRPR